MKLKTKNGPEFDEQTCKQEDEREFNGESWSGGIYTYYCCGCGSYSRCYDNGDLAEEEFDTVCEYHYDDSSEDDNEDSSGGQ